MSRLRSRIILLVLALAVLGAACSSSDDTTEGHDQTDAEESDAEIAPIFSVPAKGGGEFSLSDHIANDGRPVFLNLWASWCFPCREEMPAIDRAAHAHREIAFIGVAVQDSESDATAFADEIGVTYTLGFDNEGTVDDSYRPLGLPASYIISADGVIVERIFGKVTEEDLAEKFEKHFG
jgi:thiol-disulfide isomerase/thioredoxin